VNERSATTTAKQREHSFKEIAAAQTANAPYRADACSRLNSNSFRLKNKID